MRIALLADFLNVVDQAAIDKAPNMTLVNMRTIIVTSGSRAPAQAIN